MTKTFKVNIKENNIGFTIQAYENNIALGIPVDFPTKLCASQEYRNILIEEIVRIKEFVLSDEEKQQLNEQINSLDLNKMLS